ncbi:orotate phosphoribosyltransferase [Massilibacterium senegalense]|uniref:orotate phosphoribosyltransferase n=1 Tax=Massilibacterium senegalense TaxID=1632858 RepID=UPI0007848186|nr:orotate phosphoribosyltransferase [Massilibacterium senegalense]
MSLQEKIAGHLLDIEAVSLKPSDPFTWSSGIKSPIYCDNRLTLSFPSVRRDIENGLVQLIREHFQEVEVIAGTATAGIPHAALVSELMDLPMVYVRSKAKGHGKGNQIEGRITSGQKVVVIEDLISTGGSAITAAKALREAGATVLGIAAIFTYELEAGKRNLEENHMKAYTLTDFSTLEKVALEKGYIQHDERNKLAKWKQNPQSSDWLSE